MPKISRIFVKAGMTWFACSLATGLLMELDISALPALGPLFWHMLTVGWITQIIMGVSIWMFPGRSRSGDYPGARWNWAALALLNAGLVLRVLSEPLAGTGAGSWWKPVLVLSALLQLLGGLAYVAGMWPRILSKRQQRKRRKKRREER